VLQAADGPIFHLNQQRDRRIAGTGELPMDKTRPIEITEALYAELNESCGGFCIECRDQAYGVEPDARRYRCENCGADAVYGVEELLIRGLIEFAEDAAE